jgi:hypothetical protein
VLESNLKVLKRLDELIGNFIDIIGWAIETQSIASLCF